MRTLNQLFLLSFLFLIQVAWPVNHAYGQDDKQMLEKMLQEENEGLEALAMYSSEVRISILEACRHPEVLVRMQSMQEQSSERFQMLLSQLNREDQEDIYELTRYPGLILDISEGGRKSKKQMDDILSAYPEDIHAIARRQASGNYDILKGAADLLLASEQAFEYLLRDYPPETQSAFSELLQLPEIVTILNEDMRMTVLVGDLYAKDPEFILHKTDSLNLALADRNARELESWRQNLEQNPEAKAEFEKACKEYADEYGYDANEYATPRNVETVEIRYVYYPYRYWWGYPYWYETPYWHRYPWWYDWGWYYGPNQSVVIIGLPSWHFSYWYFYYPQHHYHYPHFSSQCVTWHHHHRNSPSGLGRAVSGFEKDNSRELGKKWLEPDKNLPIRLKEFGQAAEGYEKLVAAKPNTDLSRAEYVKTNAQKFPELSGAVKGDPGVSRPVKNTQPVNWAKPRDPVYANPPDRHPVYTNPPRDGGKVSKPVQTRPVTPSRNNPVNYRQVTPATDFHKQKWNVQPRTNPSSGSRSSGTKKVIKPR